MRFPSWRVYRFPGTDSWDYFEQTRAAPQATAAIHPANGIWRQLTDPWPCSNPRRCSFWPFAA